MEKYSVLFVDDEPNILNSVKRVFFSYPEFGILTAQSADEGAHILAAHNVDVLVSDEKMPKVQGHQFIHYVKQKYPDVVRCILTGYADTQSILRAVNMGEVYRYLLKPWKDEELVTVVRHAAEYGRMKKENTELKDKLARQNSILKKEVEKRTVYLEKALNTAKSASEEHRKMLDSVVLLLSDITGFIGPDFADSAKRVSRICHAVSEDMELGSERSRNLHIAALLHDIGKLSAKGSEMDDSELHIVAGERLLEKLAALSPISIIIRHHHQNYDGSGYPGGVSGEAIPLEARILRVAVEYDRLRVEMQLPVSEALMSIERGTHALFDPKVIQVLRRKETHEPIPLGKGIKIRIRDLVPGMILRDDLYMKNGNLCISGNSEITPAMVEHLSRFMSQLNPDAEVYIRAVKAGQ